MINTTLLLYCILAGATYLMLFSLLAEYLIRKLQLLHGVPKDMIEESGSAWFFLNYLMEFLFYVVIPSVGYGFFYLVMPFEGIKAGLAAGLFALIMGAIPVIMILSVRIKLPMTYLTYLLLTYYLKLAGSMAIIGYLYNL